MVKPFVQFFFAHPEPESHSFCRDFGLMHDLEHCVCSNVYFFLYFDTVVAATIIVAAP